MGTTRIDATRPASAPRSGTDRATTGLRQWLRVAGGGGVRSAPAQLLDELEREVALLREENARLKVARERAGERPIDERVRGALLALDRDPTGDGDEPWELLTECMLMRDSLLDACRELERGARELGRRLESIVPGAEGSPAPDPRRHPAALARDDLEGVA
jgi:hypothetical protein